MGFAIARELVERGALVTLVCGPVSLITSHKAIRRIDVTSAQEMYQACLEIFPGVDGAVMCAAVADYAPVVKSEQKLKRKDSNLTIELKPNPDIAAGLGKIKTEKQLLVGFALETENELEYARIKLRKKNLDFIVLNSLNEPGAGFRTDTNKITIIDKYNKTTKFELKSKDKVAVDIVDRMISEIL